MGYTETIVYVGPPELAEPVVRTLSEAGLSVRTASGLGEALELCVSSQPGLVITEMQLPGGSGLEVLEELRADTTAASVPVMVLLGDDEFSARLEALDADADDCLSRPFEPAELVARSRTLLRRMRKLVAAGASVESLAHRKITYLQKCALNPLNKLEPTHNIHSPVGYSYEDARTHLESAPGEELEQLEDLATRMCLERSFFESVNVCPECGHFAVNRRRTCPECHSSDVAEVEVIHHLKCDHVAPSREFFSETDVTDYVCPNCHELLEQSGVDYEALAEAYYCNNCHNAFVTPEIGCVCLNCSSSFQEDCLVTRHIYAYTISDRGLLAAQTGHLFEAALDTVLLDYDIEIYNRSYFHRQLSLEIKRAARYKRPFGLAIIRLDQYEKFLEHYGEDSRRYLAEVANIIKSSTRSADVPGKHEKDSIVILFPETDLKGTQLACEKLRRGVLNLESPQANVQLTVGCGVTAYPEVAQDEVGLLKSVSEAFAEACQSGGNVVVTADELAATADTTP